MSTRRTTALLIGAGLFSTAALTAGIAYAVFPDSDVASYAGCLNTGGPSAGTFVNVATGNAPSRPCSNNQIVAHVSGGDITAVRTPAGSGLLGGTDNGAASFALDSTGCATGGVLKWSGTGWQCGSDNNNAYSAGTGLDLTGSTFSIKEPFQLPQSCTGGQVPHWSSLSSKWVCGADAVGRRPFFGTIASDGTLEHNNGVVSVDHASAGTYKIKFDGDISECAATVSPGASNGGSAQSLAIGHVNINSGVGSGLAQADAIFKTSSGSFIDTEFHIIVVC